jgi:FdhD protein
MLPEDQPVQYLHFGPSGWEAVDARVITETSVSLTVNGQVWLSFQCTPTQLDALALGFLFNEGLIESLADVELAQPCDNGRNVDVWLRRAVEKPANWRRTSGCTGGVTAAKETVGAVAPAGPRFDPAVILASMDQLFRVQEIYRQTRGIHCSALSDGQQVFARAEDIGRHNTLDKLAGQLLLHPSDQMARMVLSTGRISSEMLQKSARLGAQVVVSRTAASSQAMKAAQRLGITLIGYARRNGFNLYTHPERIRGAEQAILRPHPAGD